MPCKHLDLIELIESPGQFWPDKNGLSGLYRTESEGVELVTHEYQGTVLLFAANVTDAEHKATIHFAGKRSFSPKWNATATTGNGNIQVRLRPYTVNHMGSGGTPMIDPAVNIVDLDPFTWVRLEEVWNRSISKNILSFCKMVSCTVESLRIIIQL
jgi:hypothetical protein